MPAKPVYTFATWRVKKDQLEPVLDLVEELTAQSMNEEGNLLYQVYQSNSDANRLILYEGYIDESALTKHRRSEHFRDLVLGKIIPLLDDREIDETTQLC